MEDLELWDELWALLAPLKRSLPMRSKNCSRDVRSSSPSSTLRVRVAQQCDRELVSFILVPRTSRVSTAAAMRTASAAVRSGIIRAPCR